MDRVDPGFFHFEGVYIRARQWRRVVRDLLGYLGRKPEWLRRNETASARLSEYLGREGDLEKSEAEVLYHTFRDRGSGLTSAELWLANDQANRRRDGKYKQHAGKMPRMGVFLTASFPRGVDLANAIAVLNDFIDHLEETFGCACEAYIHAKNGEPDHAHIVMTDRVVDSNGIAPTKIRFLNGVAAKRDGLGIRDGDTILAPAMETMRRGWADRIRRIAPADARTIDHRSFLRRGLEIEPVAIETHSSIRLQQAEGDEFWRRRREREMALRGQPLDGVISKDREATIIGPTQAPEVMTSELMQTESEATAYEPVPPPVSAPEHTLDLDHLLEVAVQASWLSHAAVMAKLRPLRSRRQPGRSSRNEELVAHLVHTARLRDRLGEGRLRDRASEDDGRVSTSHSRAAYKSLFTSLSGKVDAFARDTSSRVIRTPPWLLPALERVRREKCVHPKAESGTGVGASTQGDFFERAHAMTREAKRVGENLGQIAASVVTKASVSAMHIARSHDVSSEFWAALDAVGIALRRRRRAARKKADALRAMLSAVALMKRKASSTRGTLFASVDVVSEPMLDSVIDDHVLGQTSSDKEVLHVVGDENLYDNRAESLGPLSDRPSTETQNAHSLAPQTSTAACTPTLSIVLLDEGSIDETTSIWKLRPTVSAPAPERQPERKHATGADLDATSTAPAVAAAVKDEELRALDLSARYAASLYKDHRWKLEFRREVAAHLNITEDIFERSMLAIYEELYVKRSASTAEIKREARKEVLAQGMIGLAKTFDQWDDIARSARRSRQIRKADKGSGIAD